VLTLGLTMGKDARRLQRRARTKRKTAGKGKVLYQPLWREKKDTGFLFLKERMVVFKTRGRNLREGEELFSSRDSDLRGGGISRRRGFQEKVGCARSERELSRFIPGWGGEGKPVPESRCRG